MTEIPGLEITPPEPPHNKHKRSLFDRLADPLLASVPVLVGVLVGALTSHFAETQRVNFEREDRFRREQIERVAGIAHGYDSLAEPLNLMLAAVETRGASLCKAMPLARATEQELTNANLLHERLFSTGAGNTDTRGYDTEIKAASAQSAPQVKAAGDLLQAMVSAYVTMLTELADAQTKFAQNRETFQATLIFETKVYFPDRIRKDVADTVKDYVDIERQTALVQSPIRLCRVDVDELRKKLSALNLRSSQEMIAFAQTLEPELNDRDIQK